MDRHAALSRGCAMGIRASHISGRLGACDTHPPSLCGHGRLCICALSVPKRRTESLRWGWTGGEQMRGERTQPLDPDPCACRVGAAFCHKGFLCSLVVLNAWSWHIESEQDSGSCRPPRHKGGRKQSRSVQPVASLEEKKVFIDVWRARKLSVGLASVPNGGRQVVLRSGRPRVAQSVALSTLARSAWPRLIGNRRDGKPQMRCQGERVVHRRGASRNMSCFLSPASCRAHPRDFELFAP